jgi:uncharacterized Tic20 family protein
MSMSDELEKLQRLHQSGALSAAEFDKAKSEILNQGLNSSTGSVVDGGADARQWAMLLHLSQFAGLIIPFGGFIVPILIWQIQKKTYPSIDQHGKIVANWLISGLIYGLISALLCIVLIGFAMLIALLVMGIVFPIVGGLKANDGEAWPYPTSIKFFK